MMFKSVIIEEKIYQSMTRSKYQNIAWIKEQVKNL